MRGRVRNCQSDYQLNLTEMEEREERGEREGRGMICVLDKMTTRSHFCPEFNVHNRPYSLAALHRQWSGRVQSDYSGHKKTGGYLLNDYTTLQFKMATRY